MCFALVHCAVRLVADLLKKFEYSEARPLLLQTYLKRFQKRGRLVCIAKMITVWRALFEFLSKFRNCNASND